jgi:hypothetical protein
MKNNLRGNIDSFDRIRDVCALRRRCGNASDIYELKILSFVKNKIVRNAVNFLFTSVLLIEILECLIDCIFCSDIGNCHRM